MAADVGLFLREHKLSKVHLMGHSMSVSSQSLAFVLTGESAQTLHQNQLTLSHRGGKVVMTVALHEELNKTVSSLISVDMAPSEGRISPESVRFAQCTDCARYKARRVC